MLHKISQRMVSISIIVILSLIHVSYGTIDLNNITAGLIVKCQNLPVGKQKNGTIRNRAMKLNNSYGIVMDQTTQLNKNNETEVRLKWIGDETVKLGIKSKYLSIPYKYVIHQYVQNDPNTITMVKVLHNQLISDPTNYVIVWPQPITDPNLLFQIAFLVYPV